MKVPKRVRARVPAVSRTPIPWRQRSCPKEGCEAKPGQRCGRWRVSRYDDSENRIWVFNKNPHKERLA